MPEKNKMSVNKEENFGEIYRASAKKIQKKFTSTLTGKMPGEDETEPAEHTGKMPGEDETEPAEHTGKMPGEQ